MAQKFIGKNQDTNKIKIDSIEKAYTLGFLWGDGNLMRTGKNTDVYYIRLEMNKIDLDSIFNLFETWGKWSHSQRKRENRKEVGTITLCNKEIGWFLKTNDYLTKSISEPTNILSCIPDNLKLYWWRGLIDADGCFYTNKKQYLNQFSLAGTYQYKWKEALKLFKKLNISKYKIDNRVQNKKSKSSVIRITNKNDIAKLGKYIYSDKISIGLDRKYKKYLSI